jgi:hypothetical protein
LWYFRKRVTARTDLPDVMGKSKWQEEMRSGSEPTSAAFERSVAGESEATTFAPPKPRRNPVVRAEEMDMTFSDTPKGFDREKEEAEFRNMGDDAAITMGGVTYEELCLALKSTEGAENTITDNMEKRAARTLIELDNTELTEQLVKSGKALRERVRTLMTKYAGDGALTEQEETEGNYDMID